MFKPGQPGPGRGGVRRKPKLVLPELPAPPADTPMDEWAVDVATAAKLCEISFQQVHQLIERHAAGRPGGIAGYLHEGRKFVLIEDVANSAASRRLADRAAELVQARFWAAWYSDPANDPTLTPAFRAALVELWQTRASGQADEEYELTWQSRQLHVEPMDLPIDRHPAWCRVCWPEAAEHERVGNEMIDVPAPAPPAKRPWRDPSGARRAQLGRARAKINEQRRAAKAARLAQAAGADGEVAG